jgi:DNA-binding NarL/FixJ family response regulator
MSTGTPVIVTHPCSLFRHGLRQALPKSRFRPIRLFPTVNDDVERHLQSADDGIWVLGAEQFGPDTEDLMREVRESNHTLKVVVLAATQHKDEIIRALSAGVSGFLSQDISSDHLLKSLELILLGETVISPCWLMDVDRNEVQSRGQRWDGRLDSHHLSAGQSRVGQHSHECHWRGAGRESQRNSGGCRKGPLAPRALDPPVFDGGSLEQGHRAKAGDHRVDSEGPHEGDTTEAKTAESDPGCTLGSHASERGLSLTFPAGWSPSRDKAAGGDVDLLRHKNFAFTSRLDPA